MRPRHGAVLRADVLSQWLTLPLVHRATVASFKDKYYAIAMNTATPAGNPPTMALITPGNSAGGVQLTYNNGMHDTSAHTLHASCCR